MAVIEKIPLSHQRESQPQKDNVSAYIIDLMATIGPGVNLCQQKNLLFSDKLMILL